MKNILLVFLMILVTLPGWAQMSKADSLNMKNIYLGKSQAQKKTGYIMLAAGLGSVLVGGIFASNIDKDEFIDDNAITGALLILGGSLTTLASVPFFISSSVNMGKAKSFGAGIKIEKAVPDGVFRTSFSYYPSLSLTLNLR